MKKFISIIAAVLMALPLTVAQAKVGDVIGEALNTDIVAYVNHYAIPSYAVNGTSCVVAEDLRNFGFDVTWNNDARSLTIARNNSAYVTEMNFSKDAPSASKFANLLETDISVYAGEVKLTSYAMNGYTMIPIEELTMFGECYWMAEERALKLWINGLTVRSSKQIIKQYTPPEIFSNPATKYSSLQTGSVTGLITWQYNKYIGTKPDTGAKVLLIQTNHVPTENDSLNLLLFTSIGDDAIYSTEVDGSGNFYFDHIPAGDYFLLVLGRNTNESPDLQNLNKSLARSYLNGIVSNEALDNLDLSITINSFDIKEITVSANQTYRHSIDWGYTYF